MKKLLLILALCPALFAAGPTPTVTADKAQAQLVAASDHTTQAMTATGATDPVNVSQAAPKNHTLQATVTGSPTGCSVSLMGSLDNLTYFDIGGAQSCTTGSIMFHVDGRPVNYIKGNINTLSGGASPTISFFYTGIK